jgi:hypothetical protein
MSSGAPVTVVRKILLPPTSEDRTMLYVALIAIGIAVASLCYSIEVLDREGLELLKD